MILIVKLFSVIGIFSRVVDLLGRRGSCSRELFRNMKINKKN